MSSDYKGYPRLAPQDGHSLLIVAGDATRNGNDYTIPSWVDSRITYHPVVPRVSTDVIDAFQQRVTELAEAQGFPIKPSPSQRRNFDLTLTREILELLPGLTPAEAANGDVWNYLTLVGAPLVALWRWPLGSEDDKNVSSGAERYLVSGVSSKRRNIYQQAWWRALILGPELVSELNEDDLVGILERPTLFGSPTFARIFAQVFVDIVNRPDMAVRRRTLLREGVKLLQRKLAQISVHTVDPSQMRSLAISVMESVVTSDMPAVPQPAVSLVDAFVQAARGQRLAVEVAPHPVRIGQEGLVEIRNSILDYASSFHSNRNQAFLVAGRLCTLVDMWDELSEDARRLVLTAKNYFVLEQDSFSDRLPGGIADDLAVVNLVIASIESTTASSRDQ